jgi:catechol 2,3-dioxygenase-like lactoylglutathione lyase family enzyme
MLLDEYPREGHGQPMKLLCSVLFCAFALTGHAFAQTPTMPYDHIHLSAPDTAAAVTWYEKNFGGMRFDEAADRLMFGSTRLIFQRGANPQPSVGSSIDHIAFSVADVDAKVKQLEAAGVKVVQPVRDTPGFFKSAFVEDPWGTRIEVVQDPSLLGLHHIHLQTPDTEQMFTWLLDKFGGQRAKLGGSDAVKYSAPNFRDVWILVQRGPASPSEGHAVDHLGWRMTDLNAKLAELKGKGVKVLAEPRPLRFANGTTINYAFVEGPSGTKIELVQR